MDLESDDESVIVDKQVDRDDKEDGNVSQQSGNNTNSVAVEEVTQALKSTSTANEAGNKEMHANDMIATSQSMEERLEDESMDLTEAEEGVWVECFSTDDSGGGLLPDSVCKSYIESIDEIMNRKIDEPPSSMLRSTPPGEKSDDGGGIEGIDVTKELVKKKRIGKKCCNPECDATSKLHYAPEYALGYYGIENQSHIVSKICEVCLSPALKLTETLTEAMEARRPIANEKVEIYTPNVITLDSDDSEEENDEELRRIDEDTVTAEISVEEAFATVMEKYDVNFQLEESLKILNERNLKNKKNASIVGDMYVTVEKSLDDLWDELYKPFEWTSTVREELPELQITDILPDDSALVDNATENCDLGKSDNQSFKSSDENQAMGSETNVKPPGMMKRKYDKWCQAIVKEVDASLVKVQFHEDNHKEILHRDSRHFRGPHSEQRNAEARKESSSMFSTTQLTTVSKTAAKGPVARKSNANRPQRMSCEINTNVPGPSSLNTIVPMPSSGQHSGEHEGVLMSNSASHKQGPVAKRPPIEDVRNVADDGKMKVLSLGPNYTAAKGPVAMTSTDNKRHMIPSVNNTYVPGPSSVKITPVIPKPSFRKPPPEHDGDIYVSLTIPEQPHAKFYAHKCAPSCLEYHPYDMVEMKELSPLAVPMFCGWQRRVGKYRKGNRTIIYLTPCGIRLTNMENVHHYLQQTNSTMGIDLFCFDVRVRAVAKFHPRQSFYCNEDISCGEENVAVSCVNSLDNTPPDPLKYITQRKPAANVPLNLDEEFLTGCDCTDDCQSKDKCACWQLTIQAAANPNVGYVHRRLTEQLTTGIYECNARCKCRKTCFNRVVQNPLQLKLQIFKTQKKGWGIRCLHDIPKGGFICIYAGDLLTGEDADKLNKTERGDEYLYNLDFIEMAEKMKEGYESDVTDLDGSTSHEWVSESSVEGDESNEDTTEDEWGCGSGLMGSDEEYRVPRGQKPVVRSEMVTRSMRGRGGKKMMWGKNGGESGTRKKVKKSGRRQSKLCDEEGAPSRISTLRDFKSRKFVSIRKDFGNKEVFVIDAKTSGNVGRYFNHSCSPNIFAQNVFVNTHDLRFPYLAFFAFNYIKAGTELTLYYDYKIDSVPGKSIACFCMAPNCSGRLR